MAVDDPGKQQEEETTEVPEPNTAEAPHEQSLYEGDSQDVSGFKATYEQQQQQTGDGDNGEGEETKKEEERHE